MNVDLVFYIITKFFTNIFQMESQLNGVELPCGATIHVEPVNMDYKKTKYQNSSELKSANAPTNEPRSQNDVVEEDENLDDFFASL
jgi:hypothetical protein